jgi:5'-phosphate synthase pdxT subunit
MDVTVRRNAFGRQVDSFETDLDIMGLDEPFHAVFIRAPLVSVTGAETEILAKHGGKVVMARQGRLLACSFHPELTDDTRVHEKFLELVREEANVRA